MNIPLMKKLRNRFARMKHASHFRMAQIAIKTDCGAAGCFIYHTLDLNGNKPRLKPASEIGPWGGSSSHCDYRFKGVKEGKEFKAAQKALGLDEPTAWRLFLAWNLRTPKQAVKFIDKMIAKAMERQQ